MTPQLLSLAVTYPLTGIENKRSFYICHRKDTYLTKYMKEFIRMMTSKDCTFLTHIPPAP